MTSIIAGSTYLLAPPPPKSYPSHNPFLASFLCHRILHPHLLLQLQRKDPNQRHASPQFDLVCRKSARAIKNPSSSVVKNGVHRSREVAVQESETGHRVALIKYVNPANANRSNGKVDNDASSPIIAVVTWNFRKGVAKEWTVHKYDAKRRNGTRYIGYEFRLRNGAYGKSKGGSQPYIRWTKKVTSPSNTIEDVPSPSTPSRRQRSRSVSSIEQPVPRRHTMPTTPLTSAPSEPKWEFSASHARRIMASMTIKKLHIHSISSGGTPGSSPSNSDFDEDCYGDRELTTGRMLEFLVVSGLFVGLEEDFASKLRSEYLTAAGRRIPPSDEVIEPPNSPRSSAHRTRPARSSTTPVKPITTHSLPNGKSPLSNTQSSPTRPRLQIQTDHLEREQSRNISTNQDDANRLERTTSLNISYVMKGWTYMTSAASACVTKVMNLGA